MATDAWGPSGQSSLNRDDFNQILKACREQEWQEEEEKLLTATVNMQSPAPPPINLLHRATKPFNQASSISSRLL